jgi:hypothetical protein
VDTLEDDSGEEVVETAIMEEDETANDDAPVAEAAPATVPMPPADILTGSIDPASAQVPASDLTEDLSEFAAADARAQNTRPVTHTRFALGLDLHDTITELKEEWSSLSQRMGNILGDLQARALHQGTEAGTIKYRLVIGPFANAQAAADRCARLQTRGVRCSQTVFGGELIDAGSGALFRVQVVGDGEVDLPVSAEMKGLLDNPPIPRAKPSRS